MMNLRKSREKKKKSVLARQNGRGSGDLARKTARGSGNDRAVATGNVVRARRAESPPRNAAVIEIPSGNAPPAPAPDPGHARENADLDLARKSAGGKLLVTVREICDCQSHFKTLFANFAKSSLF